VPNEILKLDQLRFLVMISLQVSSTSQTIGLVITSAIVLTLLVFAFGTESTIA